MRNGPEVWNPLIEACAAAYGSAVVAGGAVRDWVINKNIAPRDIDVFVPAESELDIEMGIHAVGDRINDLRLLEPDLSGYGADELSASNVNGVLEGYDFSTPRGIKINVIGKAFDVYDSERLFADFDHSLCRFAWTGEIEVIGADAQSTLDSGNVIVYNTSSRTKQRLKSLLGRGTKSYDRFVVDWAQFVTEEAKKNNKINWENIANNLIYNPARARWAAMPPVI